MTTRGTSNALATLRRAADGCSSAEVLAVLVARVAQARATSVDLMVNQKVVAPAGAVLSAGFDDDFLAQHGVGFVGTAREALLAPEDRKGLAAHHTSQEVAASVVNLAFSAFDAPPARILDPSAGGGAFVLAIADRLRAHGLNDQAVVNSIVAVDVDPLAVAVARASLALWAPGVEIPAARFWQADFLAAPAGRFGPFDLVIGNPPFRSQLRRGMTRDVSARATVRERWPESGAYTDDATLFMLAALDHVDPDGVVALLQPTSILASRDSSGLRRRVHTWGGLWGLWLDTGRVFDAQVDTCAVLVAGGERHGEAGRVRRRGGPSGAQLGDYFEAVKSSSWAPLLADLSGVPSVKVAAVSAGILSDVAVCTAGFRDQFYGLRGAVHDSDGADSEAVDSKRVGSNEGRLITSGLVDPLREHWGQRPCRFDGVTRQFPVVDWARVDGEVEDWFAARRVPKVLVATQTKVIEAIVDPDGTRVPVTPIISVEPSTEAVTIWHIAAVLVSPVASALLARTMAGSALSAGAIRVTAKAIGAVALPSRGVHWNEAAELVQALSESPAVDNDAHQKAMAAIGESMAAAYGVQESAHLLQWWLDRQPRNW